MYFDDGFVIHFGDCLYFIEGLGEFFWGIEVGYLMGVAALIYIVPDLIDKTAVAFAYSLLIAEVPLKVGVGYCAHLLTIKVN